MENLVATADGVKLFYRDYGEGLPLVLCNGFACNDYAWKYMVRHFQDKMRVILWDYRGHGRSSLPARVEPFEFSLFIDDLFTVLDNAGVEKGVFAGHSMGVQTILEAYRRDAKRVAGLIPICGSFKNPVETFQGLRIFHYLMPYLFVGMRHLPQMLSFSSKHIFNGELGWLVAITIGINGYLINKEDFMPYLDHLATRDWCFMGELARAMREQSADDLLERVKVPTLVVAGDEDKFTPLELSLEMANRIPNAELLVVKHGMHTTTLEQPELVNLRIEKWLCKHGFLIKKQEGKVQR